MARAINKARKSSIGLSRLAWQNGAYFVVQPDANNAIWLNGATAASLTASDFSIVS